MKASAHSSYTAVHDNIRLCDFINVIFSMKNIQFFASANYLYTLLKQNNTVHMMVLNVFILKLKHQLAHLTQRLFKTFPCSSYTAYCENISSLNFQCWLMKTSVYSSYNDLLILQHAGVKKLACSSCNAADEISTCSSYNATTENMGLLFLLAMLLMKTSAYLFAGENISLLIYTAADENIGLLIL